MHGKSLIVLPDGQHLQFIHDGDIENKAGNDDEDDFDCSQQARVLRGPNFSDDKYFFSYRYRAAPFFPNLKLPKSASSKPKTVPTYLNRFL